MNDARMNSTRIAVAVALLAAGGDALAQLTPQPGGVPDYVGTPNWANSPALRKFVDGLPGFGSATANNLGQYIPVAIPDTAKYPGSDYYEIELGQYTEQMHSDLPPTTLRGYRQTNTADPTVSAFHYLGPIIVAEKDRPVRIKFTNRLPTGAAGNLFVPVDTSVMGAGEGPLGPNAGMFTQNRAVIHLHGGRTPWISDGTPHQWITPAGENTPYKKGVSVANVPDMPDPGDGSMTFYYTNQQSARLMFYHDHAVGITRLNVYAGVAAGYLITDPTEQDLVARGVIPAEQIPLVIQDKTFVHGPTIRDTDPTWNWGTGVPDAQGVRPPKTGDLWYPHVYVPAQNPYDISGVNPFGRWHYGPWFWPPATVANMPVPNPYYDPVNAPWQPPEMPATPNPSMPGESFFDVPLVNGTVFPTVTVQPRSYRFRILNAANDRFWNLQLFVAADKTTPTTAGTVGAVLCDGAAAVPVANCTEVKMVAAAPNGGLPPSWPTDGREGGVPDPTTVGPSFIQIGTEGGFLPAPAVVDPQPIAWNLDPTTFNFGNVSDHSLLLGPAERADAIVDFSAYAGKTLILYNDAPAAFPALDARYDYYTGAPDLRDTGGYGTLDPLTGLPTGPLPGMGPNTRTIMQIHVEAAPPALAFDLPTLQQEFTSTPGTPPDPAIPGDTGTPGVPGVFERGQEPIIVGQAAYAPAYAQAFPTTYPFWGVSRIHDNSIGFMTVGGQTLTLPMEPKAMQDEMGEAFDLMYGRMSGKLGLELPATNAGNQNFVLQNFDDPPTEIVTASPMGPPVSGDGTQIWKITHNGVDTHPIHFHIFDVQLVNRVGWDGAIRLPDANELGWKDTIRISPLEDTIVALRPVVPTQRFGVPDSIRPLNPSVPIGSTEGFTGIDPATGEAIVPAVTNEVFNFGWEYVWHCHILSHEEMDMMRPIVLRVDRALPAAPVLSVAGTTGAVVTLTWSDGTPVDGQFTLGNPANEVGYRIERAIGTGGAFSASFAKALANQTTYEDRTTVANLYRYRVVAFNAAGEVASNVVQIGTPAVPTAPTNLRSTVGANPTSITLTWTDRSNNETGFAVWRSANGGAAIQIATVTRTALQGTAVGVSVTYRDTANLVIGSSYAYHVTALNEGGASAPSNTITVNLPAPVLAPTNLAAATAPVTATQYRVTLTWTDNTTTETAFTVQRSTTTAFTTVTTSTVGANIRTLTQTVARPGPYYYRVRAVTPQGTSAWSNVATAVAP